MVQGVLFLAAKNVFFARIVFLPAEGAPELGAGMAGDLWISGLALFVALEYD